MLYARRPKQPVDCVCLNAFNTELAPNQSLSHRRSATISILICRVSYIYIYIVGSLLADRLKASANGFLALPSVFVSLWGRLIL